MCFYYVAYVAVYKCLFLLLFIILVEAVLHHVSFMITDLWLVDCLMLLGIFSYRYRSRVARIYVTIARDICFQKYDEF